MRKQQLSEIAALFIVGENRSEKERILDFRQALLNQIDVTLSVFSFVEVPPDLGVVHDGYNYYGDTCEL